MKANFNKRQCLQLSTLVVTGLLCASTASAAELVSAVPSNYARSEIGTITGSRVTTEVDAAPHKGVVKGLGGDPASFNFHQQGKSKLFLRQYTYSTTDLKANKILDSNTSGAASIEAEGMSPSVPNAHAAAANDEYIYLTGYDLGQIGVFQQQGKLIQEKSAAVVNLKNDIKQYCGYNFNESFENLDDGTHHVGDPTKAQVHGEALLVDGKNLYVATSVNPNGGYAPYDDGFLMQYEIQSDGSLKFGSYTRISRNIDQGRLNKFNDQILVSCIGGYQHYDGTGNKKHTAISIAKLGEGGKLVGTEQRRAVLPDHVKATGEDMRDLKVLPNGTAYVMTYNLSPSGSKIDAHVYQTTISNLMSEHPEDWQSLASVDSQEGWFGKLNAEYYTKRLWLELGDTLSVYTDGDKTAKYQWKAKDFASKSYERFNKVTMIDPDWVSGNIASVVMTLPAELGGGTTAAEENAKAIWKTNANITAPITDRHSFTSSTVVSIGKELLGDPHTNVIAAISGSNGNRLNISARKNPLHLQVENTVGNPTGIYAGKGTNVTVTGSEVNIITKGLPGGNSLTNVIHLDAQKDKEATLTVNASTNISMSGGLGGNGVAIQKSDRLGEKSYEATHASKIRINGDLKIAGARTDEWGIPLNRENVFSRFNNAGLLTQVEKSEIIIAGNDVKGINGNADMTVYGNGATANAKDSKIYIAGGGHIQVPAGTKYSYYALAAYQGSISMNMGEDGAKIANNKKGAQIADVQLDGDLFALPTGRLDVALATKTSYLHGLVDNGGTANLYLQNGAAWLNEGRNARYYQDNEDIGAGTLTDGKYIPKSHITNLYGGAAESSRGFIFQKNAQEIAIDNYSGHTKVVYEHDAAAPTVMKGGDIRIAKAAADSGITLSTHNAGLNTESTKTEDKNLVNAALNALANKLYYTAYTTGERNLSGTAEIAEGLVSSSATLKLAPITFRSESGQGQYTPDTPKPDTPKPDTPKPDTPKPDTPKPDTPKPDTPKPDTPKPDTPKPDTPKPDTPKPDTPKPDTPKPDTPKPDTPKPDTPKPDTPKPDVPKPDTPKPDTPKPDVPKPDTPKPDTPKPDTPKPDNPKPDTPKPDTPKPDTPKPDTPKPDTPKPDTPKPDTPKPDVPKPDTPKPDTPKPDTPKPDTPKPDTPKPDVPKPDTPKPDTPKPDTPKPDVPKPDTPKPDTPKPDTPKPDTPKPDTPKPDVPKPDTPKPTPKIEYGDYETKLMSGVKSAMMASTMAWRAEANDLMKRMGDLRLSPQDAGVWARVYRGKATSNKDNANFRMNYSTIQVGYDKKVGNDWRVGIAGSYMSGSSSYANGSGKNKEGNLGVYGTWTGTKGEYVDLIMKIGRLTNEYTVYNDYGHYVKGDFCTWGGSLSAEYGKRIAMTGGSFVEPQLELIYSHMNGVNYTGDTDYAGMKMYVHQKPFDSFIGRLGIGVGKETERSTYYARVSLYHEFAGNFHTEYSDGSSPWKTTQQNGKDTWVGVQLGGTAKLNDRTNLYGNFEKTFGGDIKTAWRVDAGIRWNF